LALRPTRPQSRADQLAARDAAQTDAFMREVDEALREDQMKSAFKRWGLPAGIAVVAGLGALGGGLWWHHHKQVEAEERGIAITQAIDQIEGGRVDLATASLDTIAKSDAAGSAALARLIQAGIALQQSKPADAVKLYDAVSGDAAAPQPLRDLATVRGVAAGFDSMGPDKALERLKPLAVPGNPWFGPAGELAALAYLKLNKPDQAGALLREIAKDKDTPDTLKARARQLAGLLGFDSIDDIARAPEEAPAAAGPAPVAGPAEGAPAAPAGAVVTQAPAPRAEAPAARAPAAPAKLAPVKPAPAKATLAPGLAAPITAASTPAAPAPAQP
jgi:hypothetical protein